MTEDLSPQLRNVVVVGHSAAGKTTLVEALLASTGTIARPGRVEDGSTVCDTEDAEIRQGRSVNLALAPLTYRGIRVNVLDAPGYADYVGELRAGLRAADAALFVVAGSDPVDALTRLLWEECAEVALPRAIVVTRLDQPRADFEQALAACQDAFGPGVLPLHVPVHAGDAAAPGPVVGLLALLSGRLADYSGGTRTERDPDPAAIEAVADARAALIEGIIAESEDESLLERYLGGQQLDIDALVADLETAVARGSFYPVLGFAAAGPADSAGPGLAVGSIELLELLTSAFPSPLERLIPPVTRPGGEPVAPLACDPDGPLCAEVIKTTSDPYVGRMSLVRVFSGTLLPDEPVHVSGHGTHPGHDVEIDEKVGHLFAPLGRQARPLGECRAGDICAVAKLSHAETGDTLSARSDPLLMQPWRMPTPLLPIAVLAPARTDEDKLAGGLARLVAEDPTLHLERNPETGQTVVWCLGEAHADVLLGRLQNRFNVAVQTVPVQVPLRETFERAATGTGRHVKQSGGHGQFAVCTLAVTPLPRGAGVEFVDRSVGGAVPHQFVPSVEKGARAQLARGLLARYPVVDVRVELLDGKAHSVDSSDVAFQTAAALALREAAHGAVCLLEPVLSVQIEVSDDHVGAVLSDLTGRRGRVVGTAPAGSGHTCVQAEVPETELLRYAIDLRSLSQGTATYTRAYLRHEPMPPQLAGKIAG